MFVTARLGNFDTAVVWGDEDGDLAIDSHHLRLLAKNADNNDTLHIKIESLDEFGAEFVATLKTGKRSKSTLAFRSYDDMHALLTAPRLALLRRLSGQGVLPIAELARRMGRDVREDIAALAKAGVVDQVGDGVSFPFSTIRSNIDLRRN